MIVSCPSCSMRYRYVAPGADAPQIGRCSRCDTEFPLTAAKRSYVLIPAAAYVAARSSTATAAVPALAVPGGGTAIHVSESSEEAARRQRESQASWIALLLGSVGALGGYYGALEYSADAITWTAVGGAAGLFFGALWIRWTLRKS